MKSGFVRSPNRRLWARLAFALAKAAAKRDERARETAMITTIVRFKLPPGESHDVALGEIKHTIPLYQKAGPALIRKQICLDAAKGEGRSIYLWSDRASAEAFFKMATANIKARTGQVPEIEYLETHVVVDNSTGEVIFA
jgi:hypothetical protein